MINAWDLIDVKGIDAPILTMILNQSGYNGIRLDSARFTYINTAGDAVFAIEFFDVNFGLPGKGNVYVNIKRNGDFFAKF